LIETNGLAAALPSINGRQVTPYLRPFSSSASHQAGRGANASQQRRYRDPYVIAQARARKAANLSKQEALSLSRARALGDPVRGIETDFVKSFDAAREQSAEEQQYLNHFLKPEEIERQLEASKRLVEPVVKTLADSQLYNQDEAIEQMRLNRINEETRERYLKAHNTVEEVMKRITNIDNGNSKDRFRINVERCIQTFGRHETDRTLPSRSAPIPLGPGGVPLTDHKAQVVPTKKRKGPDTGSSEVQIAILTAKIRNLATHLERVGNSDKVNKRNLRLLVHRRQGLLQYLRRKERAGPRWQKCIDMLGLTEGTWRGEITL
jgi:ribosomal protein S15